MTPYFMITNRVQQALDDGFLGNGTAPTTYWVCERGDVRDGANWGKPISSEDFYARLREVAADFPEIGDPGEHEDQRHLTLFIHGYNNRWYEAADRYAGLCKSLFSGRAGMGACVLFTWPSFGTTTGYLPDRAEARASAPALAQVLIEAMDQITRVQRASARAVRAEISAGGSVDESALLNACKAKTSIIAHSMGNYLMQLAMAQAWTTFNRPQLLSLVNQLIMVAADVDNDLFSAGETQDDSDGSAIANLCYRVTSLYSGADPVLGLSAGVKHFGKRRLGRSGLAKDDRTGVIVVPDNVWQIDCTPAWRKNESNIHSAYFENPRTLDAMRQILKGVDRGLIEA